MSTVEQSSLFLYPSNTMDRDSTQQFLVHFRKSLFNSDNFSVSFESGCQTRCRV